MTSDPCELLEAISAAEDAFGHAHGRPTFEPTLNAGTDAGDGEVQIQKACRLIELTHGIDDVGDYYGAILEHSFIVVEHTIQGYLLAMTGTDARNLRNHTSPYEFAKGQVHVAGGEANVLAAYDAETGEQRREKDLSGRATAAPTVIGSDVVGGDESGALTAFDAASGEMTWTTGVGGPVAGSPAVADDALLVPVVEGALVALGRTDRSERWRAPVDADPTTPFVAGDACYISAHRTVRAFALADGEELWSFETRERNYTDVVLGGVSAPVAAVDGVVLVATQAGDVYALGEA